MEKIELPLNNDPTNQPPQKEELILGKFKSQEDLVQAYSELEKKLHSPPPPPQTDDPPALEIKPKEEDIDLSAPTVESLVAQGVPQAVAEGYIKGQEATQEVWKSQVAGLVGNADEYERITAWAASNLDTDFVKGFNDAVNSGDISKAKVAVDALKFRFDKALGKPEGHLIDGRSVTNPVAGDIYESTQQMIKDMNSEEYRRDPAFREKVAQKISRSKVL